MRIQRTGMFSAMFVCLAIWTGCANRNACNPYPQQYPPQQYPQPSFQAYPYTAQPGQPIQTSPMIGVPPTTGGLQPGFAAPQGFNQGQMPPTYPMIPAQPNQGYYNPAVGQANTPFIGR